MAQHAFTELLNNAIDHSGGTQVTVSMRQTPLHLQLLVSDDGCGIFQRIERRPSTSPTHALAMLELSKGKLTSQPDRHNGRGLFFTSRLADVFDLHANARPSSTAAGTAAAGTRAGRCAPGHSIYMAIALDTTRTLDGVLRRTAWTARATASTAPWCRCSWWAARTGLESRAQAKRVASRLQRLPPRRARLHRHRRGGPRLCRRTVPRWRAATPGGDGAGGHVAARGGDGRPSPGVTARRRAPNRLAAANRRRRRQSTRHTLSMLVPPG
jgi:hypothetical protein